MGEERGYDVLKFVDRGDRCYASADYIRGKPLIQWLKYHPDIEKEELWQWILTIIRTLERFHKCTGNSGYQYVNPYSIIVSEERKLYFLDLGSQSQEYLIKKMQQRAVREAFLSSDNQYYQKSDTEEDIYGLGKTIQYILSVTDPVPGFSRAEEAKLSKIISKCLNRHSKKQYHSIHEISEQFPRVKRQRKREKKKGAGRHILAALFFISAVVVAVSIWTSAGKESSAEIMKGAEKRKEEKDTERKNEVARKDDQENADSQTQIIFDMGMLCFLELKDYEKSREVFWEIKEESELAACYAKLSGYLLREENKIIGREVEQVLLKIEELLSGKSLENDTSSEDERKYDISLLRGYALLDTKETSKKKAEIGERCLARKTWGEGDDEQQQEAEVRAYMAAAYEDMEEYEKAAGQYDMLMEKKTDKKEREDLYQKRAVLYNEMGKLDEALKILKEGSDEIEDSMMLRILYIKMQCQDAAVDREICAQTVKESIQKLPDIVKEEEFEKLKQEYDIKIEGDQIWVGR